MRTAPSEQALPDERFTQQQLDVLLGPLPRRQRLQKHHYLLEIHLHDLLGPLDKECGADVEVEVGETAVFGLSRVRFSVELGARRKKWKLVPCMCPTCGLCS
jgi:hypothetical protein